MNNPAVQLPFSVAITHLQALYGGTSFMNRGGAPPKVNPTTQMGTPGPGPKKSSSLFFIFFITGSQWLGCVRFVHLEGPGTHCWRGTPIPPPPLRPNTKMRIQNEEFQNKHSWCKFKEKNTGSKTPPCLYNRCIARSKTTIGRGRRSLRSCFSSGERRAQGCGTQGSSIPFHFRSFLLKTSIN